MPSWASRITRHFWATRCGVVPERTNDSSCLLAASSTERAAAGANMPRLNHGQLILSIVMWDGTLARGATFLRFCFQRLPPIPHVRFELKPKSRKLSLNVGVKSACEDCKNETRRSVSALDFCGRMHIVLGVFIRR